MLIAIFGESCTGKSTLADKLNERINGEIYSGKDYLRFAKNESIAKKLFQKKLQEAVTGENIIYVVAEKEHLALLPEGCTRILVTADLKTVQERFAKRMGGNLPAPVAAMLKKKHGCFDQEAADYHVVSEHTDVTRILEELSHGNSGI